MSVQGWTRYRDTLDSLLEGFQIISGDWTYLYVNPAAARHSRRTQEELLGRRIGDVYPGFEATPLFAKLKRSMDDGESTAFETPFTFPDGVTRWYEIRVQPVSEGICIHSIDIQSRKQAEATLREQENMLVLGQMAAMVAHEVKNPLASLSGALQVLKSRRPAHDPEVAVFDEMLGCVRSLDRLVQDMLVFAKPIRIDASAVGMEDIVRSALVLLENDESLKCHAVNLSVETPAPVVRADPELVKNVFRNLFLNAAEAMRDTGSIDVRIAQGDDACYVTVADTGPGIPPAVAGRIFEPFVTSKKGGTGLGLPIGRRILRLHGGDLDLVPTSAAGATFLVTLPLDTGPAAAQR